MNLGMVYLVGAGPGDSELMTQAGIRCLKQADAVVYDRLANVSVLNEVKPHCEFYYVGKKAGKHAHPQEEINRLLVNLALQGKRVVRLKGGDPFVFGRGGEEAQFLQENEIPFAVVPGVSSCYSVPAYAGIPVTHRDFASSFHVITGHMQDKSRISPDYATLAKLEGTLVFLMGLHHLPQIVEQLLQNGKASETPTAVIQWGTTARQRAVTAPLSEIVEAVQQQNLQTPAVIVIGMTVSLYDKLQWLGTENLFGKKVVLTGTPQYTQKAAALLRETGAQPVEISLIAPISNGTELLRKISWQNYTWVVLTSANGVEIFFAELQNARIDLRHLSHLRFAVIGKGTADALAKKGIFADCIPTHFDSQSLTKALIPQLKENDRVLLLRAENGSAVVETLLRQAKKMTDTVLLYRIQTDTRKQMLLQQEMETADAVFLASASAAKAYAKMTAGQAISARVIAIGAATAKAALAAGVAVSKIARQSDIVGMIACLQEKEE